MSTPTTYVDYTATAAQTDFAFTFPYLEDEHVIVEIDGVQKTLTTDYTIVTSPSTKIVLTSGATAGQIVRVRRKSQPGTDLVDFENGSVLTESELDRAYLHNRYLNEEIGELNDASLQKEAGGTDWDAGGSKIKNVGAPTLTADATTKQYVDDKVNQLSSGASAPPTKWVFTGTAGANTTYSVTDAEVNGDTAYDVSVDGSVLEPTTDYTVDPDTDTLTIVNTLSGGEDIVVIERGFGVAITGTIGADQLQSNAVTTAKINNSAVTTAKLADHSVTAVKISNTDSKFNVQTDGNVGIGTTNPTSILHLEGDSPTFKIRSTDDFTATAGPAISLQGKNNDGDTKHFGGIKAYSAGAELGELAFNIRKSFGEPEHEAMLIDSDGNVGIGTTNPDVKLQVEDSAVGTNINVLQLTNTDDSTGAGAGIEFFSANAEFAYIRGSRPADTTYGHLTLGIRGAADVINIRDEGNVGIGTVSPSAPLEVASTTGGVVFPRLTTAQRDAISTPTDGETIFNSTTNVVESWNGSSWIPAGGSGGSVQAKCFFDGTSASPTASGATNIASITKNGTGDYTVNFTSSITDPVASVSAVNASTANPVDASIHTISSSSVRILTGTNSAGLIDFAGVHLLVF